MTFAFPKPEPRYKEKSRGIGKRREQRRSGRERDPAYMAKVKRLPCILLREPGQSCEGIVEVDHVGPRPLGRKCNDSETAPLCQKHHYQRTNFLGFFGSFTREQMRIWCDVAINHTRAKLGWTPKETP